MAAILIVRESSHYMSTSANAARPDLGAALNFDECADHCLVADHATIKVDELGLGNSHSLTELDVLANRHLNCPLNRFSC